MLTLLTERHICIYKRDIDNALGKHKKYMVGELELMNGAINEFVNARFFIQCVVKPQSRKIFQRLYFQNFKTGISIS